MYAKWECKALAPLRANLERARDARMGALSHDETNARFDAALSALVDAERAHVKATGCEDMH